MPVELSVAELQAQVKHLEALLAAKKHQATPDPLFKVSDKGAVSVYNLGRFPVTLYESQWTRLLDCAAELRVFIAANKSKLAVKGETYSPVADAS